jgi:hypothetical protein
MLAVCYLAFRFISKCTLRICKVTDSSMRMHHAVWADDVDAGTQVTIVLIAPQLTSLAGLHREGLHRAGLKVDSLQVSDELAHRHMIRGRRDSPQAARAFHMRWL